MSIQSIKKIVLINSFFFILFGHCQQWPINQNDDIYYNRISGTFGEIHPTNGDHLHGAIDIDIDALNCPVRAIESGSVESVGGFSVSLLHNNNIYKSRYLHVNSTVSVGEDIDQGQEIATVQNGNNQGDHLHLEMWKFDNGIWYRLNPLNNNDWSFSSPADNFDPEFNALFIEKLDDNSGFYISTTNGSLTIFNNDYLKIHLNNSHYETGIQYNNSDNKFLLFGNIATIANVRDVSINGGTEIWSSSGAGLTIQKITFSINNLIKYDIEFDIIKDSNKYSINEVFHTSFNSGDNRLFGNNDFIEMRSLDNNYLNIHKKINSIQSDGIWNTRSHSNNQFIHNSSVNQFAINNSNAKFQDNVYSLKYKVWDAIGREKEIEINPVIDNFLPYIKKVTLSDASGVFYMGEWNLNSMETALEFQYCSTGNNDDEDRSGFDIVVESSESLSNLSLTIPNHVTNLSLTPNDDKTIWSYSVYTTFDSNEHTIEFTGTDLAGNLLRQMQGDTANLYYRTGDNTWHSETTGNNTSNPSLGTDTRHTFNIAPHLSSNCSGQSTCSDNYEDNNNMQEAWFLPTIGKCIDEDNSINAKLDLSSADEDWYQIAINYQGSLDLTLSGNLQNVYIDLLDSYGNVVNSGIIQSNGDKKIEYIYSGGAICQIFYIRVITNLSASSCIDYNLTFNWDSNVSCDTVRTLNRNAPPSIIIGDSDYCFGQTINLTATGNNNLWYFDGVESGSGSSFSYQNASVGEHLVVLLDSNDPCFIETKSIQIFNFPTANAGQDQSINAGESIQLQGLGGSTYTWSPSSSLNNPNIWNPIATPSQTTTYTLTVTENGCTDTDQVTIYVDETGGGTVPDNDDCVNAELLISNTYQDFTSGTVSGATESLGANQCTGCNCISPDDYDVYYKFVAVSNTHTITLDNLANNFDGVIEIRTGCGFNTNITCYDPIGGVSPMSLTYSNFNIGQTYYIRVFEWDYIGSPPISSTFDIAVTHSSTVQGFDLVSNIINVSDSNPDAGDSISVTFSITNNGNTAFSGNFGSALYLSTNQIYSGSDDFLVGSLENLTFIDAGQTRTFTNIIQISSSEDDGQYYIVSNPDISNDISETDEDNNYDFYPIQIGDIVTDGPNLDVKGLIITPNSNLAPGQEVNVEIEIKNEGNEDCNSFETLIVFDKNNNGNYDAGDIAIGTKHFSGIDAGERKTRDGDFFLPLNIPNTGTYQIIAIADSDNEINETDEGDNDKDRNITISTLNPAGPDIVGRYVKWVVNGTNQIVSPQNLCLDTEYRLFWEIENIGNLDVNGGRNISHSAYISKDQYYDGTDIFFDSRRWNESSHDVGVVLSTDDNNNWEGIAPGDWYLLIIADDDNDITEINEQNNVTAYPITFVNCNNTPYPDLVMEINNVTPFSSALGDYLTTEMTITNNGNAPISNYTINLYLSEDQIFNGDGGNDTYNDHSLADGNYIRIQESLTPGESKQVTLTAYTKSSRGLQNPITETGVYYLFAAIDESGNFIELDRDNNIDFVPIELNSVDCYYHISPNGNYNGVVPYSAGFGEWIDIRTEESCTWSVFGEEDWITSIGTSSGQGNDVISFYVAENPNPFSRTGHININNEIYEFVQEAKPCELLTGDAKITITSSNITDITCNQIGAIDLIVQNGFPPYTYSWSNGETTQNLENLTIGNDYTVTISDATGCSIESTFTVNENIDINATITQLENHLDASEVNNASYQWLDCNDGNSELNGETNQIFIVHDNDNYAVQITTGNCTDVSECFDVNYFHIWRNLNWINGVPGIGDHVVIDDDYDTSMYGNIEAKTLYINPNRTLTIKANEYVKVYGDLINKGAVIVENQGSFVQVENNATVTGSNFQIQKTTNPYVEYDYTYWSSPIEDADLNVIFSGSNPNRIYEFITSNFNDADGDTFDDNNDDWSIASGIMIKGKGYIVMGEGSDFPFDAENIETDLIQNVSFNGKINNGLITYFVELDANNSDAFTNQNLLGNPYPSAIDIKKLYTTNINALEGTFYFWTHDSPVSSENSGPDAYNFTNNDYATATTNGILFNQVNGGTAGTTAPEFIASGQGFFADVEWGFVPEPIIFNNEMRVTGPNNQFRRPTTNSELDRAWFNLTNSSGVYRQILIGFFDEATDNYDNGIDGKRLESGSINIDFYSLLNDTKLAINGLANFENEKVVPLGINTPLQGSFDISLDNIEGELMNTEIYLKDNLTNILHDLKQAPYHFSISEVGVFNNRFELVFIKSALSINEFISSNDLIITNENETNIRIKTNNNSIVSKLKIYDILGKLIIDSKPNKSNFLIKTNVDKGTILFINTILIDGQVLSKKFIKH